jgi:thioredoxin 1
MLQLTSRNFASETNSSLPVIVMFYATWCGKCAMMRPVFEDLEKKYRKKIKFFLVETEESPELSSTYEVDIVPTFIFFESGQPVAYMQGVIGFSQLEQRIIKSFRIH